MKRIVKEIILKIGSYKVKRTVLSSKWLHKMTETKLV